MTALPTPTGGAAAILSFTLAACLGLAAGGALAQTQSVTQFLVARPGMRDPSFRQAVVLVMQDRLGQATGVIINHPTDRSLAELLPIERFKRFTEPVYFGGPVAANGLFALFRADRYSGKALAMLPGLYLALNPDTIDELLNKPPAAIRFFSGYSGWAPGQLVAEMERGDWFVLEADADTVFRKDPSRLWEEMVQRANAVRAGAAPLLISSGR